MQTRVLDGLGELSLVIESWIAKLPVEVAETTTIAAKLVEKAAKDTYGDLDKLAPLAEATQVERERLGYTPNDPLLRDGSLLRDSVKINRIAPDTAVIGSDEPVALYHETGYVNARTGRPVPPRPVFRIAAEETAAAVEQLAEGTVMRVFGREVP